MMRFSLSHCQPLLVVFLVSITNCLSEEADFYRTFLSMVDTNAERAVAIRSPLLIDTNNAAPKLTNLVMDLAESKENGRLGGIQLGMTMEQIIARWGKPKG